MFPNWLLLVIGAQRWGGGTYYVLVLYSAFLILMHAHTSFLISLRRPRQNEDSDTYVSTIR